MDSKACVNETECNGIVIDNGINRCNLEYCQIVDKLVDLNEEYDNYNNCITQDECINSNKYILLDYINIDYCVSESQCNE